jgi:hypothetical protein
MELKRGPGVFFATIGAGREQGAPLTEGGNMNAKNGFTGAAGAGEANLKGDGGSGRQGQHPSGKRLAGDQDTVTEMDSRPDRQRARSHDSQAPGMIDRSLQAQLGRQLRAIFDGIEEEPVPERFVRLLEALEAREKQR